MDDELKRYINALLEKSEEAYLMALEIINKPTIKYRSEGFCFFICNAWELLLKAYLVNKEGSIDAINFKDKTNRTIGLDDCVNVVFTSTENPTRNNLQIIRNIRNKITHTVLPDYDVIFASSFQRCLSNYNDFFKKQFPDYPFNDTVTPYVSLAKTQEKQKSPLLLDQNSSETLNKLLSSVDLNETTTLTFRLVSTKKEQDADIKFKLDPSADKTTAFITVEKPTGDLYPYSAKQIVERVKETVAMELGTDFKFNMHTFNELCKSYGIKENKRYCSKTQYSQTTILLYSEETIEFISDLFITRTKNRTL